MAVPEIIDIQHVLEPHIDGAKLQSYNSRYLTKPGDNYGSCMLALTALIKQPNGHEEELPLIAKLPPLTNEIFWKIFQPERTCLTENTVYKILVPEFRKLQLEFGVPKDKLFDSLPRYYGSRISRDPNALKVDRDALLLQENLQIRGYKPGVRQKMYDFSHAQLVLERLAQFHALGIALRSKKSTVFNDEIRPYFERFNINGNGGAEDYEKLRNEIIEDLRIATNNNMEEVDKIVKYFDLYDKWMEQKDTAEGPYTTLVHLDLWINNIMFRYDEHNKPIDLKFVDFQLAQYESVAHDVVFFLLSSLDAAVLENNFDKFLQIYYNAFIECLMQMQISIEEYSYESFLTEIRRVGPLELPHTIFMTKVILADSSTLPADFKDIDFSLWKKNRGVKSITNRMADILRLARKFQLY